ncbi:hypothetical protein GobsT_63710 [Gemmata obscuriglobus]|uniref:TIGR03067 domain-containing protein n=1 Tax=Gemmata obscuriglobus TaxID=114 RepID=A0A2Z3HAH7_9BACT|nr:TIGR03067 domain-containing protein [Gemmata obscuriglobus]AWM35898.1 TIGR03067 domain-containing protein [Gemmata obscuriglobus]AWM38140.1 TIGR03067 domain-containing protein [Gemmata obscuriglobus]QEG28973.1 hypothetical protein GobsT_37620 [Gemmata obscuriglobus]QEG31549.1 hypothetical protein GobsT_63710 [Gemmata obscuriglobus]VTS07521.1 Uncharacterized protein OS=Planctomyces maris DSM 8797 GN=PM8797T_25221 PE=4 SV=1 [Gemmata obscuriglobus UQM 2246]
MNRLCFCVLAALFTTCVSLGEEQPKAVKDELKLLEGEWKVVKAESGGKAVKSKSVVVYTADGKSSISDPNSGLPPLKTTIALDPTKKPKWIDVTNARGRTDKGIYELNGDQMKAVFRAGGDRPTEFKTEAEGEVMYTYERVKPK